MRYSFTFLIPLLFFFLSNTISAQIPTSGLVAWYPFNNNANDASGNGRNGTVIGAALTTDRFGNTKSAYYFNGTDNYITLPTAETIYGLNPNEWTLTAWASTSAVKAQSIVTDAYSSGWDNYYGSSFSMSASNDICASARNNITGTHQTYDIYTNVIAQYNTWYLISMTVSKTTGNIKVYINSTLINTVPFNVSADYMESTPMSIGASYFLGAFTGFFSGKIDDIRMYNRALTAVEVTAIYNDKGWPGSAPIRDIDGNTYDTVKIGTQIWMKQNLKTTKYSDGTSIPNVTDNAAWGTLTTPAFCLYNNDASTNKDLYGGLYNWYTVNTGKLCPSGWHVPSDAEWTTLETYLGGPIVAGGKMKEAGLVHWATPNTGATNSSGFTALPGGYRFSSGVFNDITHHTDFWSSTEYSSLDAWTRYLYYDYNKMNRPYDPKGDGLSVRCLKDGPGSGLIASYPFNGNANDVSGNGNNGTNNGAVLTSDRFNNSGSAYRFNGSSYISVPDNNTLDFPSGSSWAVNIWVSLDLPATVDQMPISKYNSVGLGGFFMSYVGATGKLGLDGRDQTAYRLINRTTFPRSDDGKWHMLTGMRTGSVWSFWLDGIKMGELDAANTTALSNTQPLIIGGHVDVTGIYPNFKGLIDDIRIYNRALSAAEIEILYKEDGWPQSAPMIDIEGNTYDTVKIGTQTWMKQNLKTTKFNDGTSIPNITDNSAWLSLSTGAYCNYNNDISIANIYGKLYNFFAVAESRKLCPAGWHIPSDTEFKTLEMYLGMSQAQADLSYSERGTVEGGKLKESGTNHWAIPNTGANNSSEFTALPGGYRNEIGVFSSPQNWSGYWWQSSEYNTSNSWYRGVQYNVSTIWRFNYPKQGGFSVRCLKDDLNSGIIGYYPLNGNTNDESGNGINADIVISSLYSSDRFGKSSKAMNFNGTSSYAYTSANNALDSYNTGTVSFWINGSALSSSGNIALAYSTDATFGSLFIFGVYQGKAWAQFKQDSYGHNPLWIGSTEIKNDKWYHIAYVSDGNSMMKIYVNGIDNIITFDPNTTPATGSEWFTDIYGSSAYNHFISIGALRRSNQAESFFPGSVDDIRIFSRALSVSEIDALYHEDNWALPPVVNSFTPTSGPVGSLVTITGTNFDPIPDNNIVWFGAVKAAVSSSTTTELVVTVPNGTTYQPISVTTTLNGLTGYSLKPFNVKFTSSQVIDATILATKIDIATGTNPNGIAIGDIDGDGKPDIAVTNYLSNSVSIYRNISNLGSITTGSFAPKVDLTTGTVPYQVGMADLDGDGKLDLVVTNTSSYTVSVFRNISTSGSITTGSFSPKIDFTTGTNPGGIAISDIDLDGKPDLIVVNSLSNTVSLFHNNCTSGSIISNSFEPKVDIPTGINPYGVAVGDIDGDGKPDLAVANNAAFSVSILRNISSIGPFSSASFEPKIDLPTGGEPRFFNLIDIDGDNKLDMAIPNHTSGTVSVLRNTSSSGSFTSGSFSTKVDFTCGTNPTNSVFGDLDGDGKPDMLVTNTGSNTVSIFKNNSSFGSITIGSFAGKIDIPTGTTPAYVTLGDIDGDNKSDLIVTNSGSNNISVFRNIIPISAIQTAPIIGTITHPTCSLATGSVVLSGLPATGTWTLTRTPGGTTTTGTGTSSTISGLAAGTYSFTVTNAASVTSVASSDVVINAQPVTPSAPVVGTITQPTCALSSGSVALSGLPASGTWTLTRTPGGTTTTGTGTTTNISGLAANTYIYTVSNGSCTSIASANIVINAQPVTPAAPVLGTITQPTCSVATGGVDLSGLPATGTWTLTRSPGNTITTGTGASQTISDLAAGTYTYTVTNSSSCTSVSSASIVINSQPLYPSAPVIGTITQPTCSVGTGSVELSELPASGTWTLTGSPGGSSTTGTGTTRTISGLTPGTYTYSVTNASSCTSSPSSNIIINAQPITPSAPIAGTITHPTCSLATGSLELTGLPAAGTWTLTRMPGVLTTTGTGTSVTLAGIPAGTYTYSVTNGSACTSVASSNIVINPQPATPSVPVVGNITHPTCKLGTGSIFLNGLPATGTWSLTCSPGGTITNGSGTTTTITGLTSGTYSFILSIGTGCTSSFGNVIINAVPIGTIPVIIKKWNDVLICTNLNNKIDKYQWYKGTTPLTGETQEQFYWAKNQPGAYQVLTTDKDGCKNYSNIIQIGSGSKSLTAFPNPVRENVTIDLNDEPTGKAVISIFNDIGIKVLEFKTEKEFENLLHELSVETLDEGIYLIRVTVDKVNVYNTKIVVAK